MAAREELIATTSLIERVKKQLSTTDSACDNKGIAMAILCHTHSLNNEEASSINTDTAGERKKTRLMKSTTKPSATGSKSKQTEYTNK